MRPEHRLADAEDVAQPFYIAAHATLAEQKLSTLKHGDTFALFDPYGDLCPDRGSSQGLYHDDTRFLSRLRFSIEQLAPLLLSSTVRTNNAVLDVDLTNPDVKHNEALVMAKDTIHIARMKYLWNAACYEVLSLRNFGEETRRVRFGFDFDADFVDVFEVRGFARESRGAVKASVMAPDHVRFDYASQDGLARCTDLYFEPRPLWLAARQAVFEIELAPKARKTLGVTVHCRVGGKELERRPLVALKAARRQLRGATGRAAAVESSSSLTNEVLCRSMADISMLVTDTEHGPYPYAGVPWFSTPFGRDGIITALEMLWLYPKLARGVLRYLAANQATRLDPAKDAEPGKIMHETRRCELARLNVVPFERYYGSIDATPLFIVLAGYYWQHTGDRETLEHLWPHVKAGLEWIDTYGDRDGDGFVEYRRRQDSGLANQGWTDSGDAVSHEDGRLADAPIALCEVQGYVYLARVLAERMAETLGDIALAARQHQKAKQLRAEFEARFWDEELGMYVLALDGEKRPCRVRSSNAAQVLFTGLPHADRAARMAQVVAGDEFLTGWGIRTLSSRERRYNPTSYHNGSVWPHDNALIALGLSRYGHSDQVARLTTEIFDAAAHMDLRRLPELYCGMRKRRDKGPILYPVACNPQAWAAATPFALLQACLGLEVDASQRVVRLRYPRLPDPLQTLTVRGLPVADARLDLVFRRHGEDVSVNILRREGDVELVTLQR
jgi:glycogen debranching enzyme